MIELMLHFTKQVRRMLDNYDQTLLEDIGNYTGKRGDDLQHYTIKYIISELENGRKTELANRLKTAMLKVYKDIRTQ